MEKRHNLEPGKSYRLAGSIMVSLLYGEMPENIQVKGDRNLLKRQETEIRAIQKQYYRGLNQTESDAIRPRAEYLLVSSLAGISAENRFNRKAFGELTELLPLLNLLQRFALDQELWVHLGLLNLRAARLVDQNWPLVKSFAVNLESAGPEILTAADLLRLPAPGEPEGGQ